MSWLPFALAAPVVATVINFIDKLVIETRIPSSRAVLVYLSLTNGIIGIVIWLLVGAVILPLQTSLTLIGSGMLFPVGVLLYFSALAREETSRIVVLNQMTPVIVLILSALLLGETITGGQLMGFFLILFAVIGATISRGKGNIGAGWLVFWLILGASISRGLNVVIAGGVVDDLVVDFQTLMLSVVYVNFGIGLGGIVAYLLLPKIRYAFHQHIRQPQSWQVFIYLGASEGLVVVLRALTFIAFTTGPISLVTVIGGTQVFYAVLLGWLLTLIAPGIYHEQIRRVDLVRKLLWTGVLFIGLLLVRE